mmetsp:Transcript_97329/g.253669  ORF Transcript_97329/g.253669 Transcript_97329/m.253669 type:complete len:281 (-) Transcript_97329:185-1027(-)
MFQFPAECSAVRGEGPRAAVSAPVRRVPVHRHGRPLRDHHVLLVGREAQAGDLRPGHGDDADHLALLADHQDAAGVRVVREVKVCNEEIASVVHRDRRGPEASGQLVEDAEMVDTRRRLREPEDAIHRGLADVNVFLVRRKRQAAGVRERAAAERGEELRLRADRVHRSLRVRHGRLPEGPAVSEVEHASLPGKAQRIRPQERSVLVVLHVRLYLLPGHPVVAVHAREPGDRLVRGVAHEGHALVVKLEAAGLALRCPAPELFCEFVVVVHIARPTIDVA